MFFVAALVICLVIKFRFPKGKSIARVQIILHFIDNHKFRELKKHKIMVDINACPQ